MVDESDSHGIPRLCGVDSHLLYTVSLERRAVFPAYAGLILQYVHGCRPSSQVFPAYAGLIPVLASGSCGRASVFPAYAGLILPKYHEYHVSKAVFPAYAGLIPPQWFK